MPTLSPTADSEQPDEELDRHRLLTIGWRTNFRVRAVPLNEFRGGGPGRDDIPAIDHPRFQSLREADEWLDDREPVQIVRIGDDVRAYPQQILIWHEIVNNVVGGEPIVITY